MARFSRKNFGSVVSYRARADERGFTLMHLVPLTMAALLLIARSVPILGLERPLVPWSPSLCWGFAIYTGLLCGIFGSAMALDEWRGVAALSAAAIAMWRKLKLEVRGMRAQSARVILNMSKGYRP